MHPFRKKLLKNSIIKSLASLKVSVVCLVLLFILTLWGTIAQVQGGLYLAQQKFFYSWGFIFFGFIPFPGARLVLWVLFINLVCVALVRLVYRWKQAGIIIIHLGLLIFFLSAFVTFHYAQESSIGLMEGAASNVSSSSRDWELAIWTQKGEERNVIAFSAVGLESQEQLNFNEFGIKLIVDDFYRNSNAYLKEDHTGHNHAVDEKEEADFINASGIQSLKPADIENDPTRNVPGGIFSVQGADKQDLRIALYGAETIPTSFKKGSTIYFVGLRRKRMPLPFTLYLKDFQMELYPNTEIPKSFKSLVEIIMPSGASREVTISMNKPLRYKNFTLYQSSYDIDKMGRESSMLSVVQNSGRLLPHVASYVTFVGLALHLLIMAFKSKSRKIS